MATQYKQMFPLFLLLERIFVSIAQQQECNTAFECVNNSWTVSSWLYGNGYKSLSGSFTSVSGSNYQGSAYCAGASSCKDIAFISNTLYANCYGSHSCSSTHGSSYIDATSVHCSASNSCENMDIRCRPAVWSKLKCQADQSCNYANISSPYVTASGPYALYGSMIDTNHTPNGQLTVSLQGYQSGFG
eukprot:555064_1